MQRIRTVQIHLWFLHLGPSAVTNCMFRIGKKLRRAEPVRVPGIGEILHSREAKSRPSNHQSQTAICLFYLR